MCPLLGIALASLATVESLLIHLVWSVSTAGVCEIFGAYLCRAFPDIGNQVWHSLLHPSPSAPATMASSIDSCHGHPTSWCPSPWVVHQPDSLSLVIFWGHCFTHRKLIRSYYSGKECGLLDWHPSFVHHTFLSFSFLCLKDV